MVSIGWPSTSLTDRLISRNSADAGFSIVAAIVAFAFSVTGSALSLSWAGADGSILDSVLAFIFGSASGSFLTSIAGFVFLLMVGAIFADAIFADAIFAAAIFASG